VTSSKRSPRDIEANGLREPVVTWAGTDGRVWLLDGRNRLRACRLAGVEPRSQAYEGDDPVGYVVSANLCRRHLNDSQRAMLAAKLANLRQGGASGQPASLPVAAPVSQAQAARLVEVSVRSLRSAKQVSERGVPELSEAVLAGEISVSRAAKVAGLPPSEQRELVGALRMRHYRGRQEWYTPAWLVELAREAMGGIDLDPASCEEANSVVKAAQIYTAADDGRLKPWKGRAFVNPPYALPLVEGFAAKLVAEYEAGRVTEAVWLSNNSTETAWFQHLAAHAAAMCFPRHRLCFWQAASGPLGCEPLQGQAVLYFGGSADRFAQVFGPTGIVCTNFPAGRGAG